MLGIVPVLGIEVVVLLFGADGPAIGAVVGFRPPTIEDTKVGDAVEAGFLATSPAGFIGTARSVEPHIDTLDQSPGHAHVVFFEEDNPTGKAWLLGATIDVLDEVLAWLVSRVGFAGKHHLNGTGRIIEDGFEAIGILKQQRGPFVGGETPGKPDSQDSVVKHGPGHRREAKAGVALCQALAHEFNQRAFETQARLPKLAVIARFEGLPGGGVVEVLVPIRTQGAIKQIAHGGSQPR